MSHALRIVVAATLLSGCIDEPTNPNVELPEERGTLLPAGEPIGTFAKFTWSADGTEIYYQPDVGDPELKAVSIAGGSPRVLDGPRDEYLDLHVAPDGSALYFVADASPDTRRTAYRLPLDGGATTPIASVSVGRAATPAAGSLVLPSSVPGKIAYVAAPDTVYIMQNGQSQRLGPHCERLVAWSPDESELLCRSGSAASGLFRRLDIASTTSEEIQVLSPNLGAPQMVHWAEDGIKVFYYDFGGYFIRNVDTNATEQVWSVPATGAVLDFQNSAWSSDGSKVAFWVHACVDRGNLGNCRRGQSRLHVVDIATADDETVAVATGQTGGQHIAFSPDASYVAYAFEKEIFFVPVP